mmetsp:Transcript_111262/g.192884  ORF Transcript_111262/g.192884 Transcript_111262/m.192884 type:complete len:244 (+) Transcript_111262:188-919(+)
MLSGLSPLILLHNASLLSLTCRHRCVLHRLLPSRSFVYKNGSAACDGFLLASSTVCLRSQFLLFVYLLMVVRIRTSLVFLQTMVVRKLLSHLTVLAEQGITGPIGMVLSNWSGFATSVNRRHNCRIEQVRNHLHVFHCDLGGCRFSFRELTEECLPERFAFTIVRRTIHGLADIVVHETIFHKPGYLKHLQAVFPHDILVRTNTPNLFLVELGHAFPPQDPTPFVSVLVVSSFKDPWVVLIKI